MLSARPTVDDEAMMPAQIAMLAFHSIEHSFVRESLGYRDVVNVDDNSGRIFAQVRVKRVPFDFSATDLAQLS